VKIIVLTAYEDEVYIRKLVEKGVKGYVLKDEALETVARAIHAVYQGDVWFSQRIVRKLSQPPSTEHREPVDTLTRREKEVLYLLSQEKTNREIAQSLQLSERTVEFHIRNLLGKTKTRSRLGVVLWAKDRGEYLSDIRDLGENLSKSY
jgi:DNA-binding NarL/FixJ family response regulator